MQNSWAKWMSTYLKLLLFSKCSSLLRKQRYLRFTHLRSHITLQKHMQLIHRLFEKCESLAYCLIAEQHINVGHNLHEVVLEELADEGCREVQAKRLVIFRSMLCHFQDGLQRDSQEKTLEGRNDTVKSQDWSSFSMLMCSNESYTVKSRNPP